MNILSIKGTNQFPGIYFDRSKGELEFSGNSLPEDAKTFYEPVMEWISDYIENPNTQTLLKFRMAYYNTPSSKILFQILKRFEELNNKENYSVLVKWYYPSDDPDMKEAGGDFAENMNLPFEYIEYDEN